MRCAGFMARERVDQQRVFHVRVADLPVEGDGIAHGSAEPFETGDEGDDNANFQVALHDHPTAEGYDAERSQLHEKIVYRLHQPFQFLDTQAHGENVAGDVEKLLGNVITNGVFLGDLDDESAQFTHVDSAGEGELVDLSLYPRNDEKLWRVERQRDTCDQRFDKQHVAYDEQCRADLQQGL